MNGILSNWTRDQYDADDARVRSTSMKAFCDPQGPRAYYLKYVAYEARESRGDDYGPRVTDFVMGILFHELMIDGRVGWFAATHKRGTHQWKLDCARNRGLIPIPESKDAELWAWREALLRNAEARRIMELPRFSEQVILHDRLTVFMDGEGAEWEREVPSKIAIDILPHSLEAYYCIKTTRESDPEGFDRQLERLHYPFSGAFYLEGVQSVPQFQGFDRPIVYIVVTKKAPHYCYVRPLSPEWMMIGRSQVNRAYSMYARCQHDHQNGSTPLEAWPDLQERKQSDPITPTMRAMEKHGYSESVL